MCTGGWGKECVNSMSTDQASVIAAYTAPTPTTRTSHMPSTTSHTHVTHTSHTRHTPRDHTWWVQCQALLGAYKVYQHTCNPDHLAMLKGTIEFIDKHMWDKKFGEWFWGVTEFGEVSDRGTNKGNEWKASLHTTRTLVLLDRWISEGAPCGATQ